MKYWLFVCTIYVLAQFTEEHLVVEKRPKLPQLKSNQKHEDQTHETSQLDPSSRDKESEEDAQKKPKNGDPLGRLTEEDEVSDGESNPQSSEQEKMDGDLDENDLSEGNSDNSQSEGDDQSSESNTNSNQEDLLVMMPDNSMDNEVDKARKARNWSRFASELSTGNRAEIMGTNPHMYQPNKYSDLSRRFVPQYQYTEANKTIDAAPEGEEIVPIEAPQELVTLIAKQSTQRVAANAKNLEEVDSKKMLRTGDYWNGVWKEEVNPKSSLRSPDSDKVLGIIKAKIKPGNEFYELVARMKKISPRLLYIINENNVTRNSNK